MAPERFGPTAAVEPLPPNESGYALSPAGMTLASAASLAPFVAGFGIAVGLAGLGFALEDEFHLPAVVAGWAAGAVVAVLTVIFLSGYADYFPSRLFYARSCKSVAARPDAVVRPDDPDAVYIQVIPRANWGRVMLENATDVGFLKVDLDRRVILFEGDRERWVIPAAAVTGLEQESFAIAAGPEPAYFVVVLSADMAGRAWEAPLSHRHIWFGKRDAAERKRVAGVLHGLLAEVLPDRVS